MRFIALNVLILFVCIHLGNASSTCNPSITIDFDINPCFSIFDIIEIDYSTSCMALDTPLIVTVHNVNGGPPQDLGSLIRSGNSFRIIVLNFCVIGQSYYIKIATKDGSAMVLSSVFFIGESSVSLSPNTKSCYIYETVVQFEYSTKCLPRNAILKAFTCLSETLVCKFLGNVHTSETCLFVKICEPFKLNALSYLELRTSDGYCVNRTKDFLVNETCHETPAIKISKLLPCYNLNQKINISYTTECLPINEIIETCVCNVEKKVCTNLTDLTPAEEFLVLNLTSPPFDQGDSYVISMRTKDGKVVAKSSVFNVYTPKIEITTTLKECYKPNNKLFVRFKTKCIHDKTLCFEVCSNKCKPIATIKTSENKFMMEVNSAFELGMFHRLRLSQKNGTAFDFSNWFNVEEDCTE